MHYLAAYEFNQLHVSGNWKTEERGRSKNPGNKLTYDVMFLLKNVKNWEEKIHVTQSVTVNMKWMCCNETGFCGRSLTHRKLEL